MHARQHVRVIALLACVIFGAEYANAQDVTLDAAIEASRSNATANELRSQAEAEPPVAGDTYQLTLFHHRRGIARMQVGNYEGAITDLQFALQNHQPNRPAPQQIGDRWRIQNDLGNAYEARSDWFAAIEHWTGVAQENRTADLLHYHHAQLRLLSAHSVLRQWPQADKAREEAEAALARLRESTRWERWGLNALNQHHRYFASYFLRQGNYVEAERLYRASLDAAERHLQRMQRGFGNDHQEIRIATGAVRSAKTSLGDVLATQGKYGEAEVFARAGLREAIAQNGFNTTAVSYALVVVGWARFQQGDFAGAERYYRHALAAIEGSGVAPHSTALAARRAALANAQIAQGRWSDALKLFDERDKGLRSDAAQFKRFGSNHVSWALAVHKSGQAKRAASMAGRLVAGALQRPQPNTWDVAQRRGLHGMALAAAGERAEAMKNFQQAIPDLMRRDQDDDAAENSGYWRAFWQRTILEGYLELLAATQQAGQSIPGIDIADESFRIADMARGSSVQEAIVSSAARARLPDKALAELSRQDHDTRNRIVALNQSLGRAAAAPEQEQTGRVIADMRAEIAQLRAARAVLRAEIRKRFPDYADLVEPRPAGLNDVRRALARDEAVVAIYPAESQTYVWTATRDAQAPLRVVAVGRAAIERDVGELRKATDFGEGDPANLRAFDLARAHGLYRILLETDATLWKNAGVLNVIPHGALGELPFALLTTAAAPQPAAGAHAGYAQTPWLARTIAITQLPSANAFLALRRMPAGRADREAFIGFGDPLFKLESSADKQRGLLKNRAAGQRADETELLVGVVEKGGRIDALADATEISPLQQAFAQLGALPDTSEELRIIAAALKSDPARNVFVRREATEKGVKQAQLQNRRVVAFATHGLAAGEIIGLDQPALVLANPALTDDADNDGFLTLDEVLGLRLDADWVVLSACNTASADGGASEAVSGLGRAFFYAGARSLLVSNWAVETTSARELTTELFRRQAANPRLTRAEALRQSMLALMTKHAVDPVTKQNLFSYSHPVFWAPFALVGDSGAR